MPVVNENNRGRAEMPVRYGETRSITSRSENDQTVFRLNFRHASTHLSQKRPGYYLILLRSELRHRSLREKPILNS